MDMLVISKFFVLFGFFIMEVNGEEYSHVTKTST